MNITPEQTKNLLTGNYTFSQLGFSMLIARLKNVYAKNPTNLTLDNCTKEINTFLQKFSGIMKEDYALIPKF